MAKYKDKKIPEVPRIGILLTKELSYQLMIISKYMGKDPHHMLTDSIQRMYNHYMERIKEQREEGLDE